jgi:hypothetical protein
MEGHDEVSAREQHFHSQVRESTVRDREGRAASQGPEPIGAGPLPPTPPLFRPSLATGPRLPPTPFPRPGPGTRGALGPGASPPPPASRPAGTSVPLPCPGPALPLRPPPSPTPTPRGSPVVAPTPSPAPRHLRPCHLRPCHLCPCHLHPRHLRPLTCALSSEAPVTCASVTCAPSPRLPHRLRSVTCGPWSLALSVICFPITCLACPHLCPLSAANPLSPASSPAGPITSAQAFTGSHPCHLLPR